MENYHNSEVSPGNNNIWKMIIIVRYHLVILLSNFFIREMAELFLWDSLFSQCIFVLYFTIYTIIYTYILFIIYHIYQWMNILAAINLHFERFVIYIYYTLVTKSPKWSIFRIPCMSKVVFVVCQHTSFKSFICWEWNKARHA